ncbi:hypothetical protein DXX93_13990 [Thalassotalea euphylliae]|uniref:Penicillin-binding protein activator LpoB n=1 Tax=Thalassotalea euphylliae TaxID=1655234 RepID=A0A3E0TSE1_9GAMM|nr:hypothetical protein [Thalassotalea euphylliae]REL27561.1 hypothetical protein DXX93_13990 [Thalassotalea euphylliae]
MHLKTIYLAIFCLILSGCSQISFNERYKGAKWKTIVIAPIDSEYAPQAERSLEHALAVSSQINIVPAAQVNRMIKAQGLAQDYKNSPVETVITIANTLGAEGIIFTEVSYHSPKTRRASGFENNSAHVFVRLMDSQNQAIVATSHQADSSIFQQPAAIIEKNLNYSIAEIQAAIAFIQVHP